MLLYKPQIFYKWNPAPMLIHKVPSKAESPLLLLQKNVREQLCGMCLGFLTTPQWATAATQLPGSKERRSFSAPSQAVLTVQGITYDPHKEAVTFHGTVPTKHAPFIHFPTPLCGFTDEWVPAFSRVEFKPSLTPRRWKLSGLSHNNQKHTVCYHYQGRWEFEPALPTVS